MNTFSLSSSAFTNDLTAQLQRANQSICSITSDLKNIGQNLSNSYTSQNSSNLVQSLSQKSSEPQMFSYYNGSQTIIHFPFTTYTDDNEYEQEVEEVTSRKYCIQVQDLEYEQFEDFSNPSNNYKQIKYPYQLNWQPVFEVPQFIQDIIAEQKVSQAEQQQTSQLDVSYSSQQESYVQLPSQKESQYQQAVKYSSYIPKSSVNFLDETCYKSQTDISVSASYFNNSVNYLPYEL